MIIKYSEKILSKNLSVHLTKPKGNGRRLITHIESKESFVPNAMHIHYLMGKKVVNMTKRWMVITLKNGQKICFLS